MLHKDGKRAGALWWSDHVSNLTPIKSMYIGSTLVWDAGGDRPVVDIVGSTGSFDSRDQMRAAVAGYGLDYQTVETLPFDVRFVESTHASHAFNGFEKLTVAPNIDTTGVTAFFAMFQNCRDLVNIPQFDTSGMAGSAAYMFVNCESLTTSPSIDAVPGELSITLGMYIGCGSLEFVGDIHTGGVTNAQNMLTRTSSLSDGGVRLIGKHSNVDTFNMIDGSGLTREPFYDTDGNPI